MKAIAHAMIALSMMAYANAENLGAQSDAFEFSIHLTDGSCLVGQPVDLAQLPFKTSIKTVDIPLNRITHLIKEVENDSWTLHLRNGDRSEGVPTIDKITIKSLVGEIPVMTEHITEIEVTTLDHNLGFSRRDLALYYSFDDEGIVINDQSGKENHATNHGVNPDKDNISGKSALFDGIDAYLEIQEGPILQLPAWEDYTISVWFMNDGGGDANWGYGQKIIDKTIMYHDFYLCIRSNGALSFFTYEETGHGLQTKDHDYRDGEWHHAVVIKKGSHGELWVDGKLQDSSDTLKKVKTDGDLLIGYSKSTDSAQRKNWSGKLDEMLIFKRALTRSEILKLHKAQLHTNKD